jgi:hypothetical protein
MAHSRVGHERLKEDCRKVEVEMGLGEGLDVSKKCNGIKGGKRKKINKMSGKNNMSGIIWNGINAIGLYK